VEKVEAKAFEELLRRNESELRLVIDTIPAMAWSLLPDGKLEFLNQRWLDYSGLSLEQGLTRVQDAMHPDEIPEAMERWREALATGESYEFEMRLKRADGEYRWFLVRTVPLLDSEGRILRWYGTSTDIEDRKRAEHALRESTQRLQQLSRRLLEVQEEERRKLARELHDEFGQLIATANLHLHAARSGAGEAARAGLDNCAAVLQQAGDHVRSLALELRPAMLETAGLDATLRWLASQHQRGSGIKTEVVGNADEAAGDLAVACFRVAQEALTNVVKHAQARHAWIEVGEPDGRLELAVRDDGAGFDVAKTLERAAAHGQLGLLGMRERVQILGGDLRIESQPGRGTRVHVSFPRA
jgi:PAS domain S-box-containing protein